MDDRSGSGLTAIHSAEVVFAKILSQGCERREALDTDASLFFSLNGRAFAIPRPLEDGGYTQAQLVEIETELMLCGIDLLPLDPNTVLH